MNLNNLLGDLLGGLFGGGRQDENIDNRRVRPASEDPYGDPADAAYGGGYPGDVLPASQDPYGDPADTFNGHRVLDASQDPYGDPADTYRGQQVLDASHDPYGDPADEEEEDVRTRAAQGRWPF